MAGRRVLVIEDESGAREALKSLLTEEGFVVRTAEGGETGIACSRDFEPDAVVCDFSLPDIDGLQVLRRMRADRDDIMFIMVTAGCGGEEMERTLRDEADFFLDKPVDPWELCTLLDRESSHHRRDSENHRSNGKSPYA